MKDSRNPNAWTLKEIEGDSAAYVAAQEAYRKDRAVAEGQRNAERDRAAFEASFVAAGGTRSGAGDAWRKKRDEQAAEAATFADEAARLAQRGATWSKV